MDTNPAQDLSTLTLDDIFADPKRFGMPTMEEFVADPEKWRKNPEQTLEVADKGTSFLKQYVRKHIYEIEGYRCETLEQIERIARDEGLNIETDMEMKCELLPDVGGKCDFLVIFRRKQRNALECQKE